MLSRLILVLFAAASPAYAQEVLPPAAAGKFYPADKDELQKLVDEYLDGAFYPADKDELQKLVDEYLDGAAVHDFSGRLQGIIVPHAAYPYSGKIAAAAYKQLIGRNYDAAVIIAPSHYDLFIGVSIFPGRALETPLGEVRIDTALAKRLTGADKLIFFSTRGYAGEHSLEVQLPFLQTALPNTPVVPLVVGYQSLYASYALGKSLSAVLDNANVLIVASTDLSHYHPYDEAVRLDREVIDALLNYDPFLLGLNLFSRRWEACGGMPVIAALVAAQRFGCNSVELLQYANSGDITAKKDSVVGYVSAAVAAAPENSSEYTRKEKEYLLEVARKAVENSVRLKELPALSSIPERLTKKRGAFITLKINGVLRGCVGEIFAQKPLVEAVQSCAVKSALEDKRFPPVIESELSHLEYEISVLTPLKPLETLTDIEIGKNGLLVVREEKSGVLLPRVPVSNGWDRFQFLERTCLKAELPKDAWKDPNTLVFIFSAEAFDERNR